MSEIKLSKKDQKYLDSLQELVWQPNTPIQCGHIWCCIGGIGQTRVDFYQVTGITEKRIRLNGISNNYLGNKYSKSWLWYVIPLVPQTVDKDCQRSWRVLHWSDMNIGKLIRSRDMRPSCKTDSWSYMGSARPWDGKVVTEEGQY